MLQVEFSDVVTENIDIAGRSYFLFPVKKKKINLLMSSAVQFTKYALDFLTYKK